MLLLILCAFFVSSYGQNCDKLGVLVYEDMGCEPIFHGKTACPAKYTCVGIKPSKSCCYFKNQCVKVSNQSDSSLAPPCMFGCFCSEEIQFQCPIVDCAPCAYNNEPSQPGCYRNHTLNECCNCKEICPPLSETKCMVDGVEYREGDKFAPNNTCWECVCRKGWRGVNEEPFCQRKRCGVQLYNQEGVQNACAPAYRDRDSPNGTLCCPSTWFCPESTDVIKGEPTGDKVCKFGNKKLKQGQYVYKIEEIWSSPVLTYKCSCTLPPLLTCVEEIRT